MDRHLLLKHCFPVAVSQRQETTMEMAPTLPELETPSTDAITLEDQPMKDTDYINTCTPMPSTPGFVSPAPPSSPEPGKTLPLYTADLDLQSRDAPVPSPMQTTPPLPDFPVSLERPNPLDPQYFFWGAPSAEDDSPHT